MTTNIERRCECGAGLYKFRGRLTISPHVPDCKRLHEIIFTEKRGVCWQCGAKKKKQRGFDERMQMVVTKIWCPQGHSHEMGWKPPTKRDIRTFGLVEKKRPRVKR